MITVENETPDFALVENVKERARLGTHIAADAADDALFVDRNTNALGDAQSALSVRPGSAVIDGTAVTLDTARSVDITPGTEYGEPRRDVVHLTLDVNGNPVIRVREGEGGPFVWGDGVDDDDQTIANAYRPAPPDMADINGLALAIVHIPANTDTLQTQAITPIRATPSANAGGGDVEFTSMDTPGGRTNREWVLPTDVDDFGAAFNELEAQVPEGGTIYIPDGEYNAYTTAVCNTADLKVYCNATNAHSSSKTTPFVRKQADVPIFEIRDRAHIHPPRLYGADINDTTPGILATATCNIREPNVRNMGSHGIELHQPPGGNINNSSITGVMSRENAGDAVHIDKSLDADTVNANAIEVDVRYSRIDSGWAIYHRIGFGNDYRVLEIAGHEVGSGGMHLGTTRSNAEIIYHEGVARPTFKLDGENVTAEIWRSGPNNDDIFDTTDAMGANTLIQHYRADTPEVQRAGGVSVPELSSDGDLTTTTAGDGLVVTTPDGTAQYRLTVDNSGNVVANQL